MELNNCILGMTNIREHNFLEEFVKTDFNMDGELVDLGCFLGATTIALAKGLQSRFSDNNTGNKVHAFDQFIWDRYMNRKFKDKCMNSYTLGESFFDEFALRTRNWQQHIRVHPGDINKLRWSGKPIELLMIDAMKSWETASSILKKFFPCLIPSKSTVVHQDFKHFAEPWIHLLNYKFRDNFELVLSIPSSASVVFKYTKKINKDELLQEYDYSSFSESDIEDAFEYSMNLVNENERTNIAAAKIRLYVNLGDKARAVQEIKQFMSRGIPFTDNMPIVNNLVAAM